MLSSASTIFLLLFLTAAPSVLAQQPSGVPACTYTCPSSDMAGFPLDSSMSSASSGTLKCSYPPDPNVDSFYCSYDETTGALTEDHNAGFCPQTADQSCASRRKRWDNFTAVKEKAAKRAVAPQSTGPQADSAQRMIRKRVADVDA